MSKRVSGEGNRLLADGGNATIGYDQVIKPYHEKIAQLVNEANYARKIKVLDVGCGTGNTLKCLLDLVKDAEITVVDIDQKCLDLCQQYSAVKHAILVESTLGLQNEAPSDYDVVIYSHVLQYEPDPVSALECLFSKVAVDGMLIIAVSNAVTPTKILNNIMRRKYSEGYYTWDRSSLQNMLQKVFAGKPSVEYYGDYVPLPVLYRYRMGKKMGRILLGLFPWLAFSHLCKIVRKQ